MPVVPSVPALVVLQQRFEFSQVSSWIRPEAPQLLSLSAVLLHDERLGLAQGRRRRFGSPRRRALVTERAQQHLAQNVKAELSERPLKAVLSGDAVIQALIRELH